ncbi:MAG TPA: VWA domain-containing protein [Polyangiaceae bacterium]|jgi:hypothetical protein
MRARLALLARTQACACALALALVLAPGAAEADALSGTRGSIVERSVAVDVSVERGAATLVVRRTFVNEGERDDQAVLSIDAPRGGVGTGLRALSSVGGGAWLDAELMDAARAETRYRELTGYGPAAPRDPVLLSWAGVGALSLQAFPVPPGAARTVEYTLSVPAEWRDARWHVVVPAMGTGDTIARATVRADAPHDALFVDGGLVAAPARVSLDHPVDLALAPEAQPSLAAALAVMPLGRARVAVHARVEAARLSEVPRAAWVVVLLDASRSLDAGDVVAEQAAARAYLSHFEDARVALVAFDRVPRPIVPAFLDVRAALAALAATRLELHNGSQLDAALVEAARLLADAPAGAPRRILALTDLRMRTSLAPGDALAGVARSGALLHLASVRPGSPSLGRDDDDPWSALPRATGGVLWNAQASADPAEAAAMGRVFEEWARPVRVDRLSVALRGAKASLDATTLEEGAGLDDARIMVAAPAALDVRGELWSRPVRLSVLPSDDETRLWSALVFGTDLVNDMHDEEMRALAHRGRAVSPVTSYLAVEPGARPSTSGLEEGLHGGGFGSMCGTSHCACGIGMSVASTFDGLAVLRASLAPAWMACGSRGARARVTVETTSREVVDVSHVSVEPGTEALAGCLREAAWALDLPGDFRVDRAWTVDL